MQSKLSEDEFARSVDACLPRLVAVARRLADEEEMASEALQNALLKASKSWKRFDGRSQLETWLVRILIHAVRDLISEAQRRRKRAIALGSDQRYEALAMIPDPQRGPTEQAADNETDSLIRQAVMELPHRQREVFSLIVWQGMTASQVAEVVDIKVSNVHANLHAARQRLRSVLSPHLEQPSGE